MTSVGLDLFLTARSLQWPVQPSELPACGILAVRSVESSWKRSKACCIPKSGRAGADCLRNRVSRNLPHECVGGTNPPSPVITKVTATWQIQITRPSSTRKARLLDPIPVITPPQIGRRLNLHRRAKERSARRARSLSAVPGQRRGFSSAVMGMITTRLAQSRLAEPIHHHRVRMMSVRYTRGMPQSSPPNSEHHESGN